MSVDYYIGEDTEKAWNDPHICHCFNWLLHDERSPYFQAPTMLMNTLCIPKSMQKDFKKNAKKGHLYLRITGRMALTKHLKRVVNGEVIARVEKRNSLGWIIKYTLLPVSNPTPLPIPPFIKGFISIDRSGIKMVFGSSTPPTKSRGEKSKLLNPFGV